MITMFDVQLRDDMALYPEQNEPMYVYCEEDLALHTHTHLNVLMTPFPCALKLHSVSLNCIVKA
jgi:hypothetical protein